MPREEKTFNANQVIVAEFIKDLEATANQVQQLLTEIRDNKVDFATVRTELGFVVDNVKQLSAIVRDGEGGSSVLTRLALIESSLADIKDEVKMRVSSDFGSIIMLEKKVLQMEQKVNDLYQYMEGQKAALVEKKKQEESIALANNAGKWKLYVVIAGGVFTLLGSIVTLLIALWGK